MLVPTVMDVGEYGGGRDARGLLREHAADSLCQTRAAGHLRESGANDVRGIIERRCGRQHGGDPHRAVDAVLDVTDRRVAPGELGRASRISDRHIPEEVCADLGPDPFAIRVAVRGALRRRDPQSKVPIRHALGRGQMHERDALKPEGGDVLGRERFPVLLHDGESRHGVVRIVVLDHSSRGEWYRHSLTHEFGDRVSLEDPLGRVGADVAVERVLSRFLEIAPQARGLDPLYGLSEHAAGAPAEPCAVQSVEQLAAGQSHSDGRASPWTLLADPCEVARLDEWVVRSRGQLLRVD